MKRISKEKLIKMLIQDDLMHWSSNDMEGLESVLRYGFSGYQKKTGSALLKIAVKRNLVKVK